MCTFFGRPGSSRVRFATCFLLSLVFYALGAPLHAFGGPRLVQTTLDTRYMDLPLIALDGLQYRALQGQYAVEGQAKAAEIKAVPCETDTRKVSLVVRVQGPSVLFRLRDRARAINVHTIRYQHDQAIPFAQNHCQKESELQSDFAAQQQAWLAAQADAFIDQTQQKMAAFLRENIAPQYKTTRFSFFSISGGNGTGQDFSDFQRGVTLTREAVDLNNETGITIDAKERLEQASQAFERALTAHRVLASDFDYDYRRALHQNLSVVYALARRYLKARAYRQKVLQDGKTEDDAMMAWIAEREQRALKSPATVANPVAIATYYRIGQSAARHMMPVEISLEAYGNAELARKR